MTQEWTVQEGYQQSSIRVFGSTLMMILTLRNTYNAAKLLLTVRRPVFVLNLIQASAPVIALFCALGRELLTDYFSCNTVAYVNVTSITIGIPSISAILLTKAYHSVNQKMWIHLTAFVFITSYILMGIAGYFSMDIGYIAYTRCRYHINDTWIIIRCALDFYFNTILIYCFGVVIMREARTYKSSIRSTIVREGLIYAICVIISNILCALSILLLKHAHNWEMHIYGADYCLASTLICVHLQNARKRYTKRVQEMRVVGG
ncbi:hypothetical protein BDF22DRAFT_656436 [Syncephalis plumigaleata]|nr:hypothetical protein BDF22DRAFT_656436 [Syncephalis plumigaleata]